MSEKKLFIQVVEEDNQMDLTYKLKDMNFFEKFIGSLFAPLFKNMELKNKNLEDQVSELSKQVSELSKQVSESSKQVSGLSQKYTALSEAFNTSQTGLDYNYKNALDAFYALNRKLSKNVRAFNEENKLIFLQMLVNYLYKPTDELKQSIIKGYNNEITNSMLSDIDNFNKNVKPKLIDYLGRINEKWEDCVSFPLEDIYDPDTMQPYADEMEKGSPIYVVSLGYKFPKSNAEEQKPKVFIRKS